MEDMTPRQAFFEQKLAEYTLRTANYEMMAETAKERGKLFESKWYENKAKKLRKEHEDLMISLAKKADE